MDGWPCSLSLSLSRSLVGTGPPQHSRLDFRGCSIQHVSSSPFPEEPIKQTQELVCSLNAR